MPLNDEDSAKLNPGHTPSDKTGEEGEDPHSRVGYHKRLTAVAEAVEEHVVRMNAVDTVMDADLMDVSACSSSPVREDDLTQQDSAGQSRLLLLLLLLHCLLVLLRGLHCHRPLNPAGLTPQDFADVSGYEWHRLTPLWAPRSARRRDSLESYRVEICRL